MSSRYLGSVVLPSRSAYESPHSGFDAAAQYTRGGVVSGATHHYPTHQDSRALSGVRSTSTPRPSSYRSVGGTSSTNNTLSSKYVQPQGMGGSTVPSSSSYKSSSSSLLHGSSHTRVGGSSILDAVHSSARLASGQSLMAGRSPPSSARGSASPMSQRASRSGSSGMSYGISAADAGSGGYSLGRRGSYMESSEAAQPAASSSSFNYLSGSLGGYAHLQSSSGSATHLSAATQSAHTSYRGPSASTGPNPDPPLVRLTGLPTPRTTNLISPSRGNLSSNSFRGSSAVHDTETQQYVSTATPLLFYPSSSTTSAQLQQLPFSSSSFGEHSQSHLHNSHLISPTAAAAGAAHSQGNSPAQSPPASASHRASSLGTTSSLLPSSASQNTVMSTNLGSNSRAMASGSSSWTTSSGLMSSQTSPSLERSGSSTVVGGYTGGGNVSPYHILTCNFPSLESAFGARELASGQGCVGLQNLGNTCFMNSILQSLNAVPELVSWFARESSQGSSSSGWGSKASVAPTYAELITQMWSRGAGVVSPSTFMRRVAKVDSRWGDGSQQDSQEFLHSLLGALQSETNRVVGKPQYKELDLKGPEEAQAAEAEAYARSWNDSVVDDIFGGLLQSTVVCQACKRQSHCFDPFMDLAVPIPGSGKNGVSLTDCLRSFVETEKLDGTDSYKCEHCKTQQPHTKQLQIYKFPRILVLTLKRFSPRSSNTLFSRFRSASKNNAAVSIEDEYLDLTPFCNTAALRQQGMQPLYQLISVSHHSGSLEGGHYTAAAKSPVDGQWRYFNDTSVRVDSRPNRPSSSAYVLFFRLAQLH